MRGSITVFVETGLPKVLQPRKDTRRRQVDKWPENVILQCPANKDTCTVLSCEKDFLLLPGPTIVLN